MLEPKLASVPLLQARAAATRDDARAMQALCMRDNPPRLAPADASAGRHARAAALCSFETCSAKVSTYYDASISCADAIPPYGECGGSEPFACALGTACVARNIFQASCLPVCGRRYRGNLAARALGAPTPVQMVLTCGVCVGACGVCTGACWPRIAGCLPRFACGQQCLRCCA